MKVLVYILYVLRVRAISALCAAMNAAHELTEYMQRNNVKPFRNLFVPMMQVLTLFSSLM